MSESPGKRLQAARTALGLTPEDVSRATRMRTLQILALEKDDYSVFSGNSYARSFLQMYAKFLKVDVTEAMDGMPMPGKIAIENYQYLNNRDEDPAYRPTGRQSRPSSRPQNGGGNTGKWLLAAVIIVPALIFAVTLIINLHRLGLGESRDLEADSAALVEATPEATSTPSPTPTPTPVPTIAPTPIPTPETVPGTAFGLAPGVMITLPASPTPVLSTTPKTP